MLLSLNRTGPGLEDYENSQPCLVTSNVRRQDGPICGTAWCKERLKVSCPTHSQGALPHQRPFRRLRLHLPGPLTRPGLQDALQSTEWGLPWEVPVHGPCPVGQVPSSSERGSLERSFPASRFLRKSHRQKQRQLRGKEAMTGSRLKTTHCTHHWLSGKGRELWAKTGQQTTPGLNI